MEMARMAMQGIHGMVQMEDSHTSTIMGAWTMSHRRLASKRTGKFERQCVCSASVSFLFFLDFCIEVCVSISVAIKQPESPQDPWRASV